MEPLEPIRIETSGIGGETVDATTAPFLGIGGSASGGIGDVDSAGERFDPARHVARDNFNGDGTYRKKRGRKPGNSANSGSGRKTNNSANLESLTSILAIVHAGLASATKLPELALDMPEAEALAKAAANVLIEFDVQPNPKVQAIVGLVMTAGSIYGPRVYLIRERKRKEAKE